MKKGEGETELRRVMTQQSIDESRIERLESIKAEMLKALEAAEWGGVSGITTRGKEYKECSVCWGNTLDGHAPDCILSAAIKKAKGKEG